MKGMLVYDINFKAPGYVLDGKWPILKIIDLLPPKESF